MQRASRTSALPPLGAALRLPRPPLRHLATEPLRAAGEYLAYRLAPRADPRRGDGHPVIIFPGLAAGAESVATLRDHCRGLGYAAVDWGFGFNSGPRGDIDAWLARLAEHVETLLPGGTAPATLIGWSLGGLYARELGKLLAPRLRQVITIGTPFNVAAGETHVGWLFRLLSGRPALASEALAQRLLEPPPLPTTSIFSRSDGVVAWQSCRHVRAADGVQDVEVCGSHLGLVWNRAVLDVVADRLAMRPGQWHRYAPPLLASDTPARVRAPLRRRPEA